VLTAARHARQVVQTLGDIWSSFAQLRTQLTFLAIKYPLAIAPLPGGAGLVATATVLLPALRAKALVAYALDADTLVRWPRSVAAVACSVRIAYGSVECVPPFLFRLCICRACSRSAQCGEDPGGRTRAPWPGDADRQPRVPP